MGVESTPTNNRSSEHGFEVGARGGRPNSIPRSPHVGPDLTHQELTLLLLLLALVYEVSAGQSTFPADLTTRGPREVGVQRPPRAPTCPHPL